MVNIQDIFFQAVGHKMIYSNGQCLKIIPNDTGYRIEKFNNENVLIKNS